MTTKTTNISYADKIKLACNAARDAAWTVSSAFGHSVKTQTKVGATPMVLIALGETIALARSGQITSEKLKETWTPVVAASAAIPMWDLGVKVGSSLGRGALLSASAFAGVFEGFAQWSVTYLVDVATNETTREMWRQDPLLMTKLLVKDLLLNTTIGAIPGALWNVVFVLSLSALIGAGCPPLGAALLAAFLVSQVVLSSNFACGKAIDQASSSMDKWTGWDKDRQRLKELIEEDFKHREQQLLQALRIG